MSDTQEKPLSGGKFQKDDAIEGLRTNQEVLERFLVRRVVVESFDERGFLRDVGV